MRYVQDALFLHSWRPGRRNERPLHEQLLGGPESSRECLQLPDANIRVYVSCQPADNDTHCATDALANSNTDRVANDQASVTKSLDNADGGPDSGADQGADLVTLQVPSSADSGSDRGDCGSDQGYCSSDTAGHQCTHDTQANSCADHANTLSRRSWWHLRDSEGLS